MTYKASLRNAKLNLPVLSTISSTRLSGKSMSLFEASLVCQYWT